MAYAVIDTKDRVFFEITIAGKEMGESNPVTGNLKHYPEVEFVVTPAQFCEMYNL